MTSIKIDRPEPSGVDLHVSSASPPRTASIEWENSMPTVRPAEPHDMPQIMAFDALPGDRIVEIIERRMLVVEVDGVAKGYVSWQTGGCIGKDYINKLVIEEDSRRHGFAKLLLGGLGSVLSGRVFISTPVGNRAALNLLQTTGWVKAGEIFGLSSMNETEAFFCRDL